MTQEQVKLRLDKEVLELSDAFHAINHTSRTQYIQDAYIRKMIRDLTSEEPGVQISHELSEAKENLLKRILEEVERLQGLADLLKEDIAAHRIVSDENLHNNLNEILNQISVIDQAIRFYGTPMINTRAIDILKTRLNSQVITKVGKMFLRMHSDKTLKTDQDIIYNALIGCITSPTEQNMVFQNNPDQERQVILYIVDTFYREQLNKMADEIHANINHQITAQKTDIPAPV